MTLVNCFLDQMRQDCRVNFNKFRGSLLAVKKDDSKTIDLTILVSNGAEYTLEELLALQTAWSQFIPAAYVEYTAQSLVICGDKVLAETQGAWINEPG